MAIHRKPGTDTEFPAQFAGNWLYQGLPARSRCSLVLSPKTVKHPMHPDALGPTVPPCRC